MYRQTRKSPNRHKKIYHRQNRRNTHFHNYSSTRMRTCTPECLGLRRRRPRRSASWRAGREWTFRPLTCRRTTGSYRLACRSCKKKFTCKSAVCQTFSHMWNKKSPDTCSPFRCTFMEGQRDLQGDQAPSTKPPVDIDLKLRFSIRFLY